MRSDKPATGFFHGPLLFISLLSAFSHSVAQENFRVSGKITDAVTRKPLPYAQVTLVNSSLGTASNESGDFILFIPSAPVNDSLKVWYLGYAPATLFLPDIPQEDLQIMMNPVPLQLGEVEITGLDAREVIRRAVGRIPENYGDDSLLLTAFVRVRKVLNNRQAEFAEAVIMDLKDGYYPYSRSEKDREEKWRKSNTPLLVKGRVESDTNIVNALADIGKNASCLSCYFKEDLVEFYPRSILDEKEFGRYDFHMEELIQPGRKKLYHIFFDQKPGVRDMLWKGELFIESGSYAIEKVILKPSPNGFETYEKKKYLNPYVLLNIPGWIRDMPLGQTVVTYSFREGKWTLNTIRNDYMAGFTNLNSGRKIMYTYRSDVVITEVTRDEMKLRAFSGDRSAGAGRRWDEIVGPPDEKFWMNYNYLPAGK